MFHPDPVVWGLAVQVVVARCQARLAHVRYRVLLGVLWCLSLFWSGSVRVANQSVRDSMAYAESYVEKPKQP